MLVIDTDPQANATSGLGINPLTCKESIYDIYMSNVADFPYMSLKEIILETKSGIDLVPSSLDLVGAEPFLYETEGRFEILKIATEKIKENYDWILIDTPPSMGQFVLNGLIAADHIVVTFDAGVFGLHGLTALLEIFNDIREYTGYQVNAEMAILTRWDNPEIENEFWERLLNLIRKRGKKELNKEVVSLQSEIETEVRRQFKGVYYIPYDPLIPKSQQVGLPLEQFAQESPGALAYKKITENIVRWQ